MRSAKIDVAPQFLHELISKRVSWKCLNQRWVLHRKPWLMSGARMRCVASRFVCKAMFSARNFISTLHHATNRTQWTQPAIQWLNTHLETLQLWAIIYMQPTYAMFAGVVRFDNCKFFAHSWVNVQFVAHRVCLLIVKLTVRRTLEDKER